MTGDFLTIEETAKALGVSTRHARRLADSGAITRRAPGLFDSNSLDRYVQSQRRGRTRAGAEHAAWGAVAILSGVDGSHAADDLDQAIHSLRLRANATGSVVLRATSFEFDHVRTLVAITTTAALDAATSTGSTSSRQMVTN